jgi:hypothetical protein
MHGGCHCLFYDPTIDRRNIRYEQTLELICEWANINIRDHGVEGFVQNPINHYDIANLVKLNMWVDDIRKQGVVKPILVYYDGQEKYGINNGESRLRALERITSITTLTGFIATRAQHADRFAHLTAVTNFKQFAELCGAADGQQFMFTLTDPEADYGIYWYEYNSQRTAAVTPRQEWCVAALRGYLVQYPGFQFTPEWFDNLVDWKLYSS